MVQRTLLLNAQEVQILLSSLKEDLKERLTEKFALTYISFTINTFQVNFKNIWKKDKQNIQKPPHN